ncbi:MAG: helix-turn-helix domain-containing protein [Chloroflexota bacterium]
MSRQDPGRPDTTPNGNADLTQRATGGGLDTRTAILRSARTLLEQHGYHGVGLAEVARAAGLSRQTVYLHFGSKRGLLLALVDWVDQVEGLEELLAVARSAPSAVAALDALVHLTAVYTPRIYKLAAVLEVARRSDPDFDAAWQDRMAHRRRNMGAVVKWLADAGDLADGMSVKSGTDIVWTMLSVHLFEDLVVDRGWSTERYQAFVEDVLHHRLLPPDLG